MKIIIVTATTHENRLTHDIPICAESERMRSINRRASVDSSRPAGEKTALARRVGERRRVCKAGASRRGGKAGNKHNKCGACEGYRLRECSR